MQDARADGIFDLSKVNYAIMEVSGKVTFLLKSMYEPVTLSDIKLKKEENMLPAVLIMDGKIMDNNLKSIQKNKKWLIEKVSEKKYKIENIFLLIYSNNKITIYDDNYKVKGGILE
jgi:uncharacterized membrane protein YcaP (DUF421 family)